ncbi:hypothetical protein BV898_13323 [Hypsibius exemplaris]|uniref:Uncharacterized protein n=1 Tax=Hypsibius exemplaris TaxID=2072580 RepID=A0A1W0WBA2_HYPEX|nr:hypothetical protein BV898_13323 [Hypsibius exemplaris]
MTERYDVSERTIRRVLGENLQSDWLKKTKTHALSNKQVQQRLDCGPRFLKLLRVDRWKYVVFFNEFWQSMNDCGGIRDCYYPEKGKTSSGKSHKKWKQTFPKKVMCAAGVSYCGATGIYFVPPTSEVNSAFFLNNIVKPIVEKDVPRLYPRKNTKSSSTLIELPVTRRLRFIPTSNHKKSSTSGKRIQWPTALT